MLRARYYDAAVGKWISEDPIGFAAGDANLARYVLNNSTNLIDPTGLDDLGGGYVVSSVDPANWGQDWSEDFYAAWQANPEASGSSPIPFNSSDMNAPNPPVTLVGDAEQEFVFSGTTLAVSVEYKSGDWVWWGDFFGMSGDLGGGDSWHWGSRTWKDVGKYLEGYSAGELDRLIISGHGNGTAGGVFGSGRLPFQDVNGNLAVDRHVLMLIQRVLRQDGALIVTGCKCGNYPTANLLMANAINRPVVANTGDVTGVNGVGSWTIYFPDNWSQEDRDAFTQRSEDLLAFHQWPI